MKPVRGSKTEFTREDVVAASTDYFEILARVTNDAVRDWNISSGALAWPSGAASLLGDPPRAASDKIGSWFSHLHPDDLARIQTSLQKAFQSTAEHWTGELPFSAG